MLGKEAKDKKYYDDRMYRKIRRVKMGKKFISTFLTIIIFISICSVVMAEDNYVIVPTHKSFLSAESRLKDIAKKAEEQRMQSGMYGAGLGILYIGLGAAYGKSSYYGTDYSSMYYLLGGGLLLLGARDLIYPTKLENNYSETRKMQASSIEEIGARETFAEKVLKDGADEAAQNKRITATVLGGGGLIFLGSSPFYGSLLLGTAALSYFVKSDVEKAYDEYVIDKEDYIKNQRAAQVVVPGTVEVETKQVSLEAK